MPILVRAADGITYKYLSATGQGTEDDPYKSEYLVEQSGDWTVSIDNWDGLTAELISQPLIVTVESNVLPDNAATEDKQQQIIDQLNTLSDQLSPGLNSTLYKLPSSGTAIELLPQNINRKSLIITNDSTETLYVLFNNSAAASDDNYTFKIPGLINGFPTTLVIDNSAYTGAIQGVWENENGLARITEVF